MRINVSKTANIYSQTIFSVTPSYKGLKTLHYLHFYRVDVLQFVKIKGIFKTFYVDEVVDDPESGV